MIIPKKNRDNNHSCEGDPIYSKRGVLLGYIQIKCGYRYMKSEYGSTFAIFPIEPTSLKDICKKYIEKNAII